MASGSCRARAPRLVAIRPLTKGVMIKCDWPLSATALRTVSKHSSAGAQGLQTHGNTSLDFVAAPAGQSEGWGSGQDQQEQGSAVPLRIELVRILLGTGPHYWMSLRFVSVRPGLARVLG